MFKRIGSIVIKKDNINEENLMELVILNDVVNFLEEKDFYIFQTKPDKMNDFLEGLENENYEIISSEVLQTSDNLVSVDKEVGEKIINLLDYLDEHEDVQKIHCNFEMN